MINNATRRAAHFTRRASYVFLLLQLLWIFLLYSSWAVESGTLQSYLDATQLSEPQEPTKVELPEFIQQPLALVVLITMIVLSAILLVRTPKKATQITVRATNATAKTITPTIQKITHIPKSKKKWLSEVVLVSVILSVSLLSWMLTIPILNSLSLPTNVSWFVSALLCVLTIATLFVSSALGYLARNHARS